MHPATVSQLHSNALNNSRLRRCNAPLVRPSLQPRLKCTALQITRLCGSINNAETRSADAVRWPKSNPRCTLSDPDLDYFALPSPFGRSTSSCREEKRSITRHETKKRHQLTDPTMADIYIGIFTICIGIIIVQRLMVILSHTDCKQQQVMMVVATGKARKGSLMVER